VLQEKNILKEPYLLAILNHGKRKETIDGLKINYKDAIMLVVVLPLSFLGIFYI
jgi:hypothetical protein